MLAFLLGVWHLATLPAGDRRGGGRADEYAKLMGKDARQQDGRASRRPPRSARPSLKHLRDPFYDSGPNDKGIGIQLALLARPRRALGFLLAALVAIPLGFVIGMSPLLYRALDPFIQVLKPISPLAWMPLALYTIKDSSVSGVFVIFICSIWPMLINTAFGVAAVRRDWLNVAQHARGQAAAQGASR